MWSLICLQLLVAAAGQVHGVEFHLSAVNLMRTDDSLPCGTVRCVDEVDPSNGYSIKSLQIRKQLNREVLVDLNQEDNSFNCKFEGVTANGNWTSHKAEAGLTLYNSQDCNDAKFICEVVHVDKLGIERTGSSSGRINGRFSVATQQTKTKLTCPKAWVDDITDSLSSLANLESNVAKHIIKSESKMQDLASSVADLQSTVEQLTKSNAKILSKLNTLTTGTINEVKTQHLTTGKLDTLTGTINKVKTQHPTTCPRSASASPDKRYQVVYPTDGTPYLCDTDGGWTVIQRRIDGTTNFYRNWYNYTHGFGSFDEDFWLGLKRIHQMSSSSTHELNITMKYEGKFYFAHYDNFKVSGEEDNYRLSIGAYTGTAGEELNYNNIWQFTTYDKDNDGDSTGNCAQQRLGAWWYDDCTTINLNGKWGAGNKKGPEWRNLTDGAPATMTEMKIRKMI